MDQHAYLILSVCFLLCLAIILTLRTDLRKKGIAFFFLAAPAGVISEYWYMKDYWQPPTVLGDIFTGSGEDLLFAGSVTSLSLLIYPFIFKRKLPNEDLLRTLPFFLTTFSVLVILQLVSLEIGFPTILTGMLCNTLIGALIAIRRRDLLKVGVSGGLLMGGIVALIYLPFFGWLYPDYWNSYWLMKDSIWGFYVLPGLPSTELLWYMSLGFFASTAYPFALDEKYITTNKITPL